jgi:putative ATP-binding cassette transporter
MVEIFKLFSFLVRALRNVRHARTAIFFVIVTGLLSGAVTTAIIALINSVLTRTESESQVQLWSFVGLCLLLPILRFGSGALLIRLSMRAQLDLRMHLCRKILAVPLRQVEELGDARLLASLTDDLGTIVAALGNLPLLVMHSAVVLGCVVYMGWLAPGLLPIVVAVMVVGIGSYRLPAARAQRYFRRTRELWDELFQHFRAVVRGTKELKLHRGRREAFLATQLEAAATDFARTRGIGDTIYAAASSWGQVLFFVLIGVLLFATTGWVEVSRATLMSYVVTILYMLTPLDVVVNLLPHLGRARIAADRVERLGFSLEGQACEARGETGVDGRAWRRLELCHVTHAYRRDSEEGEFSLGPIDLVFEPGELVFIVGGNGSGKTTLAKLIAGLYTPTTGEIRLDGMPIDDTVRDGYRQLFSVVFTDFYLFDKLLGLEQQEIDSRAFDYLRMLQLDHKVQVEDGTLSTLDLSQGQRKRLALLTAFLEDRPVYLFDEWAADQDPQYKEVFYLKLLPELKARGKTVLVISHDDRYYHLGDRIVKLENGQLISDTPAMPAPAAAGRLLPEVDLATRGAQWDP